MRTARDRAELARMRSTIDQIGQVYDSCLAAAEHKIGEFRIVSKDGGWALQQYKPLMNGTCEWRQEFWSSSKQAAEAAQARRS